MNCIIVGIADVSIISHVIFPSYHTSHFHQIAHHIICAYFKYSLALQILALKAASPVVGRGQLLHNVPHVQQSHILALGNGRHETLVQLVGEERVGQLSEIHFKHRRHAVDVLKNAFVAVKVGHTVLVKGIPTPKNKAILRDNNIHPLVMH